MMKQNMMMTAGIVAALLALNGLGGVAAFAQEGGPPKLSTNPGTHVIFPAKDQTPEQQEKDQLAAYTWASQQTGWDPYKAHDELVKKGVSDIETADATRGQAVGGAARGALLGLAIGAIAQDAGKGAAIGAAAGGLTSGMRGRQVRKGAQASTEGAVESYKQKFQQWDKCFVAAMEGKGYTVK